ncbi:gliding motility lipoprotein GldH [Cyclobacterium plantarum]|uniref:gliding motility lipoprotein GldH n=1 Tax=Cyclobacterium plantarum TaxID=2716263 RepID=UPI003F700F08
MITKCLSPILYFLGMLFLLSGCNGDRLYESFEDFPNQSWLVSDTVSFSLDSLPPDVSKMLSVGIRYNDSYEYHNLYLRYLLRDSLNNVMLDSLVNLQLFDSKSGQPLGSGFGNRRTLYDTLPANQLATPARVEFIQYMRKDTLTGIESVGLKISEIRD